MSTTQAAPRPRVAFVLSGGGSHGAAQVGMLRALLDAGIVPDVVVGCSVGALNGVFVAADPTAARVEALATVWRSLDRKDVFGSRRRHTLLNALARRDHLYENSALLTLIDRFCPVIDLADLAVPMHVVTTDLDAGRPTWWTHGPARGVLAATSSLPGLFAPFPLPGPHGATRHIDGGVVCPVPVARAAELDVDVIYVLDLSGGERLVPTRLNALDVLVHSFTISRYANLPDHASHARPGQEVVVLPSPQTSGTDLTDFANTDTWIEQTRVACADFLADRAAPAAIPAAGRLGWLRRIRSVRPARRAEAAA
jgi:NTE family protein